MVAMASYLPAVLLAMAAGVTADQNDRRKIMLISDAFRFILVLLIPGAFLGCINSETFISLQPALQLICFRLSLMNS
jgi:hypothetical protein